MFLSLNLVVQAQSYEGTWYLVNEIQGTDTIKFNIDLKKGSVEEFNIYSREKTNISRDTFIENDTQFVSIGIQNTLEMFSEEEYEEGSCPCFFYQYVIKNDLFILLCESRREFLSLQLKNEELYLTVLKYFDWKEKKYKVQATGKTYIYKRI